MKTRNKSLIAAVAAVIITFAYLFGLSNFIPHSRLTLIPGIAISDYAFNSPADVAWSDSNFSTGWAVRLTTNNQSGVSGFISNGSEGYLYYNFSGGHVEEVEVQDNVTVDTSVYEYLTVHFRATTNDTSVNFSPAVISEGGTWVGLPWNHVSTAQQVLTFDIPDYFSGNITAILFRITNDYNEDYIGGLQGVFMSLVSISKSPPILGTSSFNALFTELLPEGRVLEVKGTSPPTSESSTNYSIISAVYSALLNVDLSSFHYLNLTVMTDSPKVMARVVIWLTDQSSQTVLLTNYEETTWHQVLIDLKPFGITGNTIAKIELGYLITVGAEAETHSVYYGQISFNKAA